MTRATWRDFEALFESRGAPSYCWCMAWRTTAEEARITDAPSRKRMMRSRVDAGTPVGLLGYLDGKPIAWCSIAPRSTYRGTLAEIRPGDRDESVWSLVCFYIRREHRGQGILHALVDAARAHARARGGSVLEAYPVDEDSPSYRYGGFVPTFEKEGFTEVGRAGSRRHVMRLRLDRPARKATRKAMPKATGAQRKTK